MAESVMLEILQKVLEVKENMEVCAATSHTNKKNQIYRRSHIVSLVIIPHAQTNRIYLDLSRRYKESKEIVLTYSHAFTRALLTPHTHMHTRCCGRWRRVPAGTARNHVTAMLRVRAVQSVCWMGGSAAVACQSGCVVGASPCHVLRVHHTSAHC